MKMITDIQEGLQVMFKAGSCEPVAFEYEKGTPETLCDYIVAEGERIPVFTWRYNPRINGLYTSATNVSKEHTLSTLKTLNFAPKTRTLAEELFRELDIAEHVLGSEVNSIMGYGNEMAANFVIMMKNGTMCNLETSVTLPAEANRQSKHTVFTTDGFICDMVTDNSILQEQVHLFNDGMNPIDYTDDMLLFGLPRDEQDLCYAIYGILSEHEDREAWKARVSHLTELVNEALATLKTGKKYVAG